MNKTIKASGSCLCGAVTLAASAVNPEVGACHCSMCRTWSGGPFLAVDCQDAVKIEGEESVSIYDSSDWAQRAFCVHCGTLLFYRLKQANQYIISAGLFDKDAAFHFDHQIFIEEKPDYYAFSNDTKNMTGAEVFAQYSDQNPD